MYTRAVIRGGRHWLLFRCVVQALTPGNELSDNLRPVPLEDKLYKFIGFDLFVPIVACETRRGTQPVHRRVFYPYGKSHGNPKVTKSDLPHDGPESAHWSEGRRGATLLKPTAYRNVG